MVCGALWRVVGVFVMRMWPTVLQIRCQGVFLQSYVCLLHLFHTGEKRWAFKSCSKISELGIKLCASVKGDYKDYRELHFDI